MDKFVVRWRIDILKMDSEEARYADRIKAVAWKIAKDEGATFITLNWVAKKLDRSPRLVTDNWNKCFTRIER